MSNQFRPYARKDELVAKKVVPQNVYDRIKDQVIAKHATESASKETDMKGTASKAAESLPMKKMTPASPANLNPQGNDVV